MHGIRPKRHSDVQVTLLPHDMLYISILLLFIITSLTMLLFMPYILSTLLVLTLFLRGLRFMLRRYTQMSRSHYRRCSSEVGKLYLPLESCRVRVLCYDVLVEVRDFADRVVGIGCQSCKRLRQPMCHFVFCY